MSAASLQSIRSAASLVKAIQAALERKAFLDLDENIVLEIQEGRDKIAGALNLCRQQYMGEQAKVVGLPVLDATGPGHVEDCACDLCGSQDEAP